MEPVSFEELFETYEKPIYHYVLKMVEDEQVAEDLTQEVFLKVHRALSEFEGRSKLSTWIYRIATNTCLDHFRTAAHKRGKATVSLEDEALPKGSAADLRDAAPSPDEGVVREEMSCCVREYVEELPEDYKVVVVLHDFQGLKNREIAEILGCSLDTVKIRLHRGRRKLEGALDSGCRFYRDENNVLRCDRKPVDDSDCEE